MAKKTKKTEKIPTLQQTFNVVAKHLLRQKKQAVENGKCRYRTGSGLRCAIGCLIPDSEYSPSFEGVDIYAIARCIEFPPTLEAIARRIEFPPTLERMFRSGKMLNLLSALQGVHDDYRPPDWRDALKYVAAIHKLRMPKI